jgi:excisionase family DNA binding protein
MDIEIKSLLIDILDELKKRDISQKEFLSLFEASRYLDKSKSFIYKLTCTRKIPYYIPNGKTIYFKKSDLDHWIIQNRISSEEELCSI